MKNTVFLHALVVLVILILSFLLNIFQWTDTGLVNKFKNAIATAVNTYCRANLSQCGLNATMWVDISSCWQVYDWQELGWKSLSFIPACNQKWLYILAKCPCCKMVESWSFVGSPLMWWLSLNTTKSNAKSYLLYSSDFLGANVYINSDPIQRNSYLDVTFHVKYPDGVQLTSTASTNFVLPKTILEGL